MSKALIVGVDPGNTSAVAAVDLEGKLEFVESSREFPPDQIINRLIREGRPVVVACDTREMSSTVEKVASSLGAKKFSPQEDLEARRKKELGQGENSHEIDAVASAFYAYNNFRRKIRKIDRYTQKTGEPRDEVARRYFSGKTLENAAKS